MRIEVSCRVVFDRRLTIYANTARRTRESAYRLPFHYISFPFPLLTLCCGNPPAVRTCEWEMNAEILLRRCYSPELTNLLRSALRHDKRDKVIPKIINREASPQDIAAEIPVKSECVTPASVPVMCCPLT